MKQTQILTMQYLTPEINNSADVKTLAYFVL